MSSTSNGLTLHPLAGHVPHELRLDLALQQRGRRLRRVLDAALRRPNPVAKSIPVHLYFPSYPRRQFTVVVPPATTTTRPPTDALFDGPARVRLGQQQQQGQEQIRRGGGYRPHQIGGPLASR